MAEVLSFNRQGSKADIYAELLPQIKALLEAETDLIANQANIAAVLQQAFAFHWVGFYRVQKDELVLGPFQGPLACTRIGKGKGVCGSAWQQAATIVVPDVDQFPGHIACSSLSRSEIVVPYFDRNGEVAGVLDIDSEYPDAFSAIDQLWLEKIAALLP
ncbi:Free methionine-R-sulfoxide reductase [compost metagenome]|jgi:GAF domain-containing protein